MPLNHIFVTRKHFVKKAKRLRWNKIDFKGHFLSPPKPHHLASFLNPQNPRKNTGTYRASGGGSSMVMLGYRLPEAVF